MACVNFRKAGVLIVALTLAALLSWGSAGSVPADLETLELDEDLDLRLPKAQTDADVVIDVLDDPPRYSDATTLAPVSVVLSGQTVLWQWEGGLSHSVTSDDALSIGDEGFDSGLQRLDGGDPYTFEVTFSEPGVYKVFCQAHMLQHGVVVVV